MKQFRGSRILLLVLGVVIIGATTLGMTGGGQQQVREMLMAYYPAQNVLIDNNRSFQGRNTAGAAASLLTMLNTNNTRLNAMGGKNIIFTVGGLEKARITSTGFVGIGTTGPTGPATPARLEVQGGSDHGIWGQGYNGVVGKSDGWLNGAGVYGWGENGADAAYFNGNVTILGNCGKASGNFEIDHPLDPENKYLLHSFVESPDMMNVYNGNTVMDDNGEVLIELPSYFEALNRDFRYQLTCIGGYAPVYVAEKISNNHFKIAGGKAGLEVSWQVTGIRQDAFAKAHPIVVEKEKPANEKGLYLHPKEWGQPEEKGIAKLHNP